MSDKKNSRGANPAETTYPYESEFSVASGTEMTGLMPTPPENKDEAESYGEIYDVPVSKGETRTKKRG